MRSVRSNSTSERKKEGNKERTGWVAIKLERVTTYFVSLIFLIQHVKLNVVAHSRKLRFAKVLESVVRI